MECQGYMYEDLDVSRVKPQEEGFCESCGELLTGRVKLQLCFVCGYCDSTFFTKIMFSRHLRQKHSNVKCIPCTKQTKCAPSDYVHVVKHQPTYFTECAKCKFFFIDESNFATHMSRCHGIEKYDDTTSEAGTAPETTTRCWVEHVLKVVALEACTSCLDGKGKTTKDESLYCDICFASVSSFELKLHHTRTKHFQCASCDAWFPHRHSLSYHRQFCRPSSTHVIEGIADGDDGVLLTFKFDSKLRKCPVCVPVQWFACSRSLRVHSVGKHICCSHCDVVFRNYLSFMKHIDAVQPVTYVCSMCDRKYKNSRLLRVHMDTYHGNCKPHEVGPYRDFANRKVDSRKPAKGPKSAINESIETKLNIVYQHVLEWPVQMKLGVGRRKAGEIIASISQSFDCSSAGEWNEDTIGENLESMLADLFCNVTCMLNDDAFSWVFSCDPLELLADIETVLLKHLTRFELEQHLNPNLKHVNAILCDYCFKQFDSHELLQSHVEEDHYCPVCKKGFVEVKAHKHKGHAAVWPIICYLCGEKYCKVPELRRHMFVVHDIEYEQFMKRCSDVRTINSHSSRLKNIPNVM